MLDQQFLDELSWDDNLRPLNEGPPTKHRTWLKGGRQTHNKHTHEHDLTGPEDYYVRSV